MFTEQQLEHIKSVARKKKNQGELSVWLELANTTSQWQPEIINVEENDHQTRQLMIIKYCAEECKRQHSGEMSVYDMLVAWNFAQENYHAPEHAFHINLDFIEKIGQLVEPIDNKKGFRTIPIGVNKQGHAYLPDKWYLGCKFCDEDFMDHWEDKADWREVPRLLTLLLEAYYDKALEWHYKEHRPSNPLAKTGEDQFYFEYENIHPFVDGNGRSGKILYNYLLGRLDDPIMPPNFFGGNNP